MSWHLCGAAGAAFQVSCNVAYDTVHDSSSWKGFLERGTERLSLSYLPDLISRVSRGPAFLAV